MSNKETSLLIINYLKSVVEKNEVSEEFVESIDVAIDCLADAFGVNKNEDASILSSFKGKNLPAILSAFKSGELSSRETSAEAGLKVQDVPVHIDEIDEETVKKADALKLEGNKAMAARDFEAAIVKYTDAIALVPTSAVYLSNRAAAYSSLRKHEKAIEDANAAIKANPKYSKAYSRLGLAYFALNKPKESLDAYRKGLEVEGDKPSEAMKKGYETAKKRVEEQLGFNETEVSSSNTRSAGDGAGADADVGAGSGAGAGTGGLSDFLNMAGRAGGNGGLGDMLNNPQLMEYAGRLMQDPGALNNLMSNPAIQQMARQFGLPGAGAGAGAGAGTGAGSGGSSGGMPDLASLMSDPNIANLASQFLGGRNNNNNNNNNPGN